MTQMLADGTVEAPPAASVSVLRDFFRPLLSMPFVPRPAPAAPLRLVPAAFAPSRFMPALRSYSGLRHRESRGEPGPVTLGRIGALEVRLAVTAADVRRAQRLRYEVFYEEMSAAPAAAMRLARRDFDAFDGFCDHLLVLDHDCVTTVRGRRVPRVVGTYRLLRQEIAARHGGFYTAGEFDIAPLLARHPHRRFLELGRSCVLASYRNKRTVELLWHGIWAYVRRHGIDVMFGCASIEGTDPARLARPLAFLHHFAPTDPEWSASALPRHAAAMDLMAADAVDAKAALVELPPLIKGYLRLGAQIGRGAVVDHQFGTTDVLIVLPIEKISPRYLDHFGVNGERHAA
ncbi:GNAT family N-acetyltransferase [Ancylobacter sp. TS-1]|uniref:GNAT family N-acetyltransferase n=1 Tax=Ancylobacter sp. TS-1 TaxID=1850374 RepID=UPI001265B1AC|nr:GNAT family N-acyltransferase [Ancylobacter sp. TS-1]QFR33960.1 GNAT family N-acetyltransferase [Ancylobacter sp. TS-1]